MGRIYKGCDVAKWNQIKDYNKLREDGIEFAIIKAINKSLNKESALEKHYKGFTEAGIKVLGTYHYSYANTIEKAKAAVQAWIEVVNGRCNIFFLDWEDTSLPKDQKAIEIINTYAEAVHRAGFEFQLYCGLSWYNYYLKKYKLPYKLWIARYYNGYIPFKIQDGVNGRYRPNVVDLNGWQYTSSGKSDGVNGSLDLNLWYDDIYNEVAIDCILVDYNPYTEPTRNVCNGATGNDANWVLWYLWRFGMLVDSTGEPDARMIDGYLLDNYIAKVKQAQSILGLVPDGIVGTKTKSIWKKIC